MTGWVRALAAAVRRRCFPPRQRARTPSILQMEAVECGAACLGMILGYYRRWVPLEELRTLAGVSRDGTKASNLLKVARRYKMVAKGFKKDPQGLTSLPIPSILHWNFNHFVVYEGYRGEQHYINDPASGPRTVSAIELSEAFTGVVLAFEPGPDFRPGGQAPRGWANLWQYLRPMLPAVTLVWLISMVLVLPGVLMPALVRLFIDDVLVAQLNEVVVVVLIGLLMTTLASAWITALQQRYLLRLETAFAVSIAGRYIHRLLQLPARFFLQRTVGDLVNRLSAAERIGQLLSGSLAHNMFNLTAVVFYALAMAWYDLTLALIGVGLALVNALAVRLFQHSREQQSRKLLQDQGKLLATAAGTVRSLETLKTSGGADEAFSRFAGYQAQALSASQALGMSTGLLLAAPALMAGFTTAAILGIGGLRVMDGHLTIGALVAIQALMVRFNQPIEGLVGLASQIQAIRADLARLDDVAQYPVRHGEHTMAASPAASAAGRVSLRQVTYGHAPLDPPLIDRLSLDIEPGTLMALVGTSGSGKSTLGRVMAGMYPPWSGQVMINGADVSALPPTAQSGWLAHVDQDIFLFSGTLRDNLTLWDPDIEDERLIRALKDAAVYDEVMQRPGGLDTEVAEGGANFSGGERQRLEIARALVRDPAVLILDEATSALDPTSEKQVDDNLRRRGCTCVMIAHRLSTVRDADRILVLDRGAVVESGGHDELLALNGTYAAMAQEG